MDTHPQLGGYTVEFLLELGELSGKNTVTREVVHVAEAARFDSSSSSSDGLATKMDVARAGVVS